MISNVTINGRPIGLFVDDVPPGPEPEPFVQYNYTTFKARINGTLYWDPIGGTYKYFNNSTSKDLTTGTNMATNGGSGDWPNLSVTQDHLYELVWSDTDLISTFNTISSGNDSSYYDSGSTTPNNIFGELYSIDFWYGTRSTYSYSSSPVFGNVTIIPQDYRNLHNGQFITNCSNMFKNAPITNSIEKFILAMQQACPNLTTTTGCFSGCTTAPDYNYCLTTYPNWF